MKIYEYKGKESEHKGELSQINRIINIIINWGKETGKEWIYFIRNTNYINQGLNIVGNTGEWSGEVDLLAITNNMFIIMELKNIIAQVKGQTVKGLWGIKHSSENKYWYKNDYYIQCSRMKTYFSRNYYPNVILPLLDYESKLRPDVLLIFRDGSNFKISFVPVREYNDELYNELHNKLHENDIHFFEGLFWYDDSQKQYTLKTKLRNNKEVMNRLHHILNYCEYKDRNLKWFHVITESQLVELLPQLGSDSFRINEQTMDKIIEDFKLIKENERVV
jgi:hypothetical protein